MNCSRVPVRRGEHEHHVVPDRSRVLDFEAHRIIDVFAHYPSQQGKGAGLSALQPARPRTCARSDALYYTSAPAAAPPNDRKSSAPGAQSGYAEASSSCRCPSRPAIDDTERVRELSVRCPRLEPASRRPAAGRRGRRRLLPDRRHVGAASLRCRSDQAAGIAGRHGAQARRHVAVRRDGMEAHQFPVAQPSRLDRPRRTRTGPGRCASCWRCSPTFPTRSPSSGSAASRASPAVRSCGGCARRTASTRRAASRSPCVFDEKAFEGSASSCSARCSTASLPNTRRSTASPKR